MKHIELYELLEKRFPASLRCPWDNDGIMCMCDPDREVKKVLVTLDITEDAVGKAIDEEFDLILSHHPLIFKGVTHLDVRESVPRRLLSLACEGVTALSYHTRLDAAVGGVNDALAEALELSEVSEFEVEGIPMGRIGYLPREMSPKAFALYVKEQLGAEQAVMADGGSSVRRVAVLGGAGDDVVKSAREAGADAFVTGELKYHTLSDAHLCDMTLVALGHYETEQPVCERLYEMLENWIPDAEIEIYHANTLYRL